MGILNEGDNSHLRSAFRTLQGADRIDALYARGPITLTELAEVTPRSQSTRARVEGWPSNLQVPIVMRLFGEIHR